MTIARTDDGAAILDEVCATLQRFVVLPSQDAAEAYTLWIAATHRQDAWEHATRFVIKSPIKRCGKTRAQEIGRELVHQPLATGNVSVAALVHSLDEKDPPTILLDEADLIFGDRKREKEGAQELRGILNAGHARGMPYMRWDPKTRKRDDCPSFAMALIAGIGDMPDTLEDRAVVISMRRRASGESIAAFRRKRVVPRLHDLRERLHQWARALDGLAEAEPKLPVEDRAADNWEPLVAIADAAGGDWPKRARDACKALSGNTLPDEGSAGERLLADLLDLWTSSDSEHADAADRRMHALEGAPCVAEALHTSTILDKLHHIEEAPWSAWYGHSFSPRDLATLLRQYDVRSKTVRIGDAQAKGYHRADLADPWRRYVPPVFAVPASQTVVSAGGPGDGTLAPIRPTSVPSSEASRGDTPSVPEDDQGEHRLWDGGTDGTADMHETRPAVASIDLVERLAAHVAEHPTGSLVHVAEVAGEDVDDDRADRMVEEIAAANGRLSDRGIIARPVPGHPGFLEVRRRATAQDISRDVLGPAGLGLVDDPAAGAPS